MLKTFRCYQLAVQFYRSTRGLAASGGLKDQFNRASSSIALNLAEGSAKTSKKDQVRYYEIALGSIRECQAIFDLLETEPTQRAQLDQLGGTVYALCRALRR